MAPVFDPVLVLQTIAGTLELGEEVVGARPPLERLKGYLQGKRLLLVLDNFEQVVAAAPMVTELLSSCPFVKVLVTSREALRISGEHEYPVPPLEVPDQERPPEVQALSRNPAVALLVQRAAAVKSDFRLEDDNAPAVADICVRLDGLPLAIELAAVRIKVLSPHKLLAGLRNRLLTGGARDLPDRQQTLKRTIEWSHDLLNADERVLFWRLSVFVGGCTLEAAEVVCDATGDLPMDVVDGLTSLADKSLLCQSEEAEPCLRMLEAIREYGLERLAASGETEEIKTRHAAHYLTLAEEAELTGAQQGAWLERLEAEHDNLRAALVCGSGGEGDGPAPGRGGLAFLVYARPSERGAPAVGGGARRQRRRGFVRAGEGACRRRHAGLLPG